MKKLLRSSSFLFIAFLSLGATPTPTPTRQPAPQPVKDPYKIESKSYDVKKSTAKAIVADAHYKQTPDEVYKLATKFADFPKFIPRFKESTVKKDGLSTKELKVRIGLPVPFSDVKALMKVTLDAANHSYQWEMLKGNFKSIRGTLWVTPEEGGSKIKIATEVDPGQSFSQNFVGWAVRNYLPQLLTAVGKKLG